MTVRTLPFLTGFILELGLAAFVLWRNRTHPSNVSFAAGMALLASSSLCNFLGLTHDDPSRRMFFVSISNLLEGGALVAWLVFSLSYARLNYQIFLKRWKWGLFAVGVALLGVWAAGALTGSFVQVPQGSSAQWGTMPFGWSGRLYQWIMLTGSVAVLFNLETTYRNAFWVMRWKIKYVLLGSAGIWIYHVYHLSRNIMFSADDIGALTGKALVMLLCTLVLMVALVLQRQLDAKIFVSRYVVYQSITLILTGVYLLFVISAGRTAGSLGGNVGKVTTILLIFTALLLFLSFVLSENFRRRTKVLISKHFYKYKYDYRVIWLELTERLSSKFSEKAIAEELAWIISNALSVERIIVWVFDEMTGRYRPVYSTPEEAAIQLESSSPLVKALGTSDYVINVSTINTDKATREVSEEEGEWLRALQLSSIVPVRAGETLVGFFGLGESMVSSEYNYEDYDLLKTVAKQAANSLFTIQLTRDLMKGKELETFHKMSSFLLHDLKNSVSMLKLVAANAAENMSNPQFQRDAMTAVQASVEKMNRLIEKISSFPRGLELHPKEIFLDQLVKQAADQIAGTVNSGLRFQVNTDGPLTVMGDTENLHKVLINLVLNAVDAMDGKGVLKVGTYKREDRAVVTVRDEGCGMTDEFIENSLFRPFQSTKKRGIGIGLYQCKFIVEAHKGWIEVESRPGAGTEFRVVLPLIHSS